jgi:hypothetical protein
MVFVYATLALLLLLLVFVYLTRPAAPDDLSGESEAKQYARDLGEEHWLDLSQRIFDPADSCWLRDKLGFPELAHSLTQARKRLAIQWLMSLRNSFDELIRTPEADLAEDSAASSPGSWRLLWMTVRFNALITYALMVVRLFGPYHRLSPSFGWVRIVAGQGLHGTRLAVAPGEKPK